MNKHPYKNHADRQLPTSLTPEVEVREKGASARTIDVYYCTEVGKRLKSKRKISDYCRKKGIPYDHRLYHFGTADVNTAVATPSTRIRSGG